MTKQNKKIGLVVLVSVSIACLIITYGLVRYNGFLAEQRNQINAKYSNLDVPDYCTLESEQWNTNYFESTVNLEVGYKCNAPTNQVINFFEKVTNNKFNSDNGVILDIDSAIYIFSKEPRKTTQPPVIPVNTSTDQPVFMYIWL